MVKLIFFDMEGTLFKKVAKDPDGHKDPSAWRLLAKHLGDDCLREEDESQAKWERGEYAGYVEWMQDTLGFYKKYGLDGDFFEKVISSIEYHPGVEETFAELKRKGYMTGLVSGGFKAQADRASKDLKIDHAFAACEIYWDDDGKILHWNLLPSDYEGKLDFMQLIMKEHGLKPEDCAFVGDGKGDIPFAKAVGLSIAFNGVKELQEVCTHSINQPEGEEDFRAILEFLEV